MAADHTPTASGLIFPEQPLGRGTGKYETHEVMQDALAASGCDTVTVAVRRERLLDDQGGRCSTSSTSTGTPSFPIPPVASPEDVRTARLGRELLDQLGNPGKDWVARGLGRQGDLVSTPSAHWKPPKNWSPMGSPCWSTRATILSWPAIFGCRRRQRDAAGSIGSGRGIANPAAIRIIIEQLTQPEHGGDLPIP